MALSSRRSLLLSSEIRSRIRRNLIESERTSNRSTWKQALSIYRGCWYCGRSDVPLERDHVIPISHGGLSSPSNEVPSCHEDNLAKASRDFRVFMTQRGYDVQLFMLRWLRLRRSMSTTTD